MDQGTEKNNVRRVIEVLLTGKAVKSREVAALMSETSGVEVKTGTVSGILSRLSDPEKCDLGLFIQKHRSGSAWVFQMDKEALALTPDQAYGLSLKIGKDRYPLDQAIQDIPGLRGRVKPETPPVKHPPLVQVIKMAADRMGAGDFFQFKSSEDRNAEDRKMEITLRYSTRYAISLTASFKTFVLLCAAVFLTIAAVCAAIYAFLYPVLVILITIIILIFIGVLVRKKIYSA